MSFICIINCFRNLYHFLSNNFIVFNSYIVVLCDCSYRIAKPISPKSIFSHITSAFLNFTCFIVLSDFLCIFCSLVFEYCRQNTFFTTSRIYSTCGLVKFPVLILSYNLFNAHSNAPMPEKKLLSFKSSNRYGIALYSSTNM